MNLIANTGIQLYSTTFKLNNDHNFKMNFYEENDTVNDQLKLIIAHEFKGDDIWVNKYDLFKLGYMVNGEEGADGKLKKLRWENIKADFEEENIQPISNAAVEDENSSFYTVSTNKLNLDKFLNHWIPLPFFPLDSKNRSNFGATNWCRFKITASQNTENEYNLLIAFDTRTYAEGEGFEEEDLRETPVFSSAFDKEKEFSICDNEFLLIDYCSSAKNCEWVDEYIFSLIHPGKTSIDELKLKKNKLSYLAHYIYLVRYIQKQDVLPKVKLYSNRNVEHGNVDLVIDVGNSRTCAVLFDDSDFSKVEALSLQNFTLPIKDNKINKTSKPFDMRLAFRKVDFGVNNLMQSMQFVYPSLVRLGVEAKDLTYNSLNSNCVGRSMSSFSSPKRYLWDSSESKEDWEFIRLEEEPSSPAEIKGISEQLHSDGTLNVTGYQGVFKRYSKKELMTFAFLEIFAQAKMQMNSFGFRRKWGSENMPRQFGRTVITCPTAMSKKEQIALRKCAEDAHIILKRFYENTYNKSVDEKEIRQKIKVVPSVANLRKVDSNDSWVYDEATCAQFVFLFSEISKRYSNRYKEYFDLFGKNRTDLDNYNKKSLTVGSIDIGAGTTDLMIAAYTYSDSGTCKLKPIPLFWESFYEAGDDLLKKIIQNSIIEGPSALITSELKRIGKTNISELIHDFFGVNNSRMSVLQRQIRHEFNLQISIPIAQYILELLKTSETEYCTVNFKEIFKQNFPSKTVLSHFEKHFGFKIQDLDLSFDRKFINKVIHITFDSLISKISTLLYYFECDIVLLSGRPTSLREISNLFIKYYSVSPDKFITLHNYRIGSWYPFQDGNGFMSDTKSIVAVGAMICEHSEFRGGLNGFSLDLESLITKMNPTTDYFVKSVGEVPFISPDKNNAILEINQLPFRVYTKQLDTKFYPTRPFFLLNFNLKKIETRVIERNDLDENNYNQVKEHIDIEINKYRKRMPFKFTLSRDYEDDKESLVIESVEDCNNDDMPTSYFTLHVQSMKEDENYWMDTGEFSNLSINN